MAAVAAVVSVAAPAAVAVVTLEKSEVEGKRPKAPPNREIDLGACVAAGEGRCVTSAPPGPRCFWPPAARISGWSLL